MGIKKIFSFIVFSSLCLLSVQIKAMKVSCIRDGAEEILYGMEEVRPVLVSEIIHNIQRPEQDCRLQFKIREKKESEEIIKEIRKNLLIQLNNNEESDIEKRLYSFLTMEELNYFDPIPLSYLIERINYEYRPVKSLL